MDKISLTRKKKGDTYMPTVSSMIVDLMKILIKHGDMTIMMKRGGVDYPTSGVVQAHPHYPNNGMKVLMLKCGDV